MIGDRRIVFAQPLQRSNLCASHRQRRWLTYLKRVSPPEAVADLFEISYRPLRGRFDEGPSKGPAVS